MGVAAGLVTGLVTGLVVGVCVAAGAAPLDGWSTGGVDGAGGFTPGAAGFAAGEAGAESARPGLSRAGTEPPPFSGISRMVAARW